MNEVKINIPVSWQVLYVGLKNNWITTNQVVHIALTNKEKLEDFSDDILVELSVNEDDRDCMLQILKGSETIDEEQVSKIWQLNFLYSIKESEESIEAKLKEIEKLWSRFDYPIEWREFIYYLPNENSSSSQEVYQNFLNFLASQ